MSDHKEKSERESVQLRGAMERDGGMDGRTDERRKGAREQESEGAREGEGTRDGGREG